MHSATSPSDGDDDDDDDDDGGSAICRRVAYYSQGIAVLETRRRDQARLSDQSHQTNA